MESIPLRSALNFRAVGDLPTTDGRRLRRGLLYLSGTPQLMSAAAFNRNRTLIDYQRTLAADLVGAAA